MDQKTDILYEKIVSGDRIALGKAMTLVESERAEDRLIAIELVAKCELQLLEKDPSLRLAISGAPGVGKSTLIEALGLEAISKGHKVGVMTIDPTSSISHGSILGDKSRMAQLSVSPSAFVRSSPAGSVLGGMGRRSYEVLTLLAAAGYDLILLETVGVGQSEHTVREITDGFLLVVQPGGGDELQGIKRGITELADIVIVNKADGQMADLAKLAKSQYQSALHYFSPLREGWNNKIVSCSALEQKGIEEVYHTIRSFQEIITDNLPAQRKQQKAFWLNWTLGITAHQLLINQPIVKKKLAEALTSLNEKNGAAVTAAHDIEETMKALIYSSNLTTKK